VLAELDKDKLRSEASGLFGGVKIGSSGKKVSWQSSTKRSPQLILPHHQNQYRGNSNIGCYTSNDDLLMQESMTVNNLAAAAAHGQIDAHTEMQQQATLIQD